MNRFERFGIMLVVVLLSFGIAFTFMVMQFWGSLQPTINMKYATKVVVNVERLDTLGGRLHFQRKLVAVDSTVNLRGLLQAKEEIVLRIATHDRISIIQGDNDQF
jgi:hypothetical protein